MKKAHNSSKTELTDVIDQYSGNKLGKVFTREEVHKKGLWHGVFHVWFLKRGNPSTMYVQKRAQNKDVSPGYLDVTVGGHYQAGENAEDGLREVKEELGIDIEFKDLIFLGKRVSLRKEKGVLIHQIVDTFIYETYVPVSEIHFDEEIDSLIEIPIEEVFNIFTIDGHSYQSSGFKLENGFYNQCQIEVTKSSFIPALDNYPYKIAVQINNYLDGKIHFAI
jgi:isopentenyldiphosphate isomerase